MDTDSEAFIRWALDDARTLEERYTTELLVEDADHMWHLKNNVRHRRTIDQTLARERERFLNPAYQPSYSETSVRHAAEVIAVQREWQLATWAYKDRPARDIAVLRFMPALTKLTINTYIADLSLLAELPNLRDLTFTSPVCEDFRPLARCTWLRRLRLNFGVPWPEVAGLETLQQLEFLGLCGNLLVLPPGLVFAHVHEGLLSCQPLQARSVRDLPRFPACEFLTLEGVERLDGIDAFPRVRNLTLTGPVRDFTPLTALPGLTWLSYKGALPLDVAPLVRAPALLHAGFETQHTFGVEKDPPRDYAPLAASPTLREVVVTGCRPVELEVAALNAALTPWDDFFLRPEPRPVPPLRVIIAPRKLHPRQPEAHSRPDEQLPPDIGIRECEEQWIKRFGTALVGECIGHRDWGCVGARGIDRYLFAGLECYEDLPRFPEIVEALRTLVARLRSEYVGELSIWLRVQKPELTPAQQQLLDEFQEREDEAAAEQRRRDREEHVERLHLFQLKQQQGEAIDPKEFSPSPRGPDPTPPWEEESDEDDAGDEGSGNFAVKTKPDPPPDPYDDDHPLARNYHLSLTFTLGEVWLDPRFAGLGLHLLQREAADEEIAEEPPPAA
ncbi:MAG TPA: hypothetical protein VGO11_02950 [Chthoniobacteraceae bacterium]|jgi:hypothetical protein|nr:hypothetical protein [Chthoniobacteraceae bacterium]